MHVHKKKIQNNVVNLLSHVKSLKGLGFLESAVEKEELAAVFWEICVCSKGL